MRLFAHFQLGQVEENLKYDKKASSVGEHAEHRLANERFIILFKALSRLVIELHAPTLA